MTQASIEIYDEENGYRVLKRESPKQITVEGFASETCRGWVEGDENVSGETALSDAIPPDGLPPAQTFAIKVKYRLNAGNTFIRI